MKKRYFRCTSCRAPRLIATRWWHKHLPTTRCRRPGCGHVGLRRAYPSMILPGMEVRPPVGWTADHQRAAVESLRKARAGLERRDHEQGG